MGSHIGAPWAALVAITVLCAVGVVHSQAPIIDTNGFSVTIEKTSGSDVLDESVVKAAGCAGYVRYTVTNVGDTVIPDATGVVGPVLVTAPANSTVTIATPGDYLYNTTAAEGAPFNSGINISNFGLGMAPGETSEFAIVVTCPAYRLLDNNAGCACANGTLPLTFQASGDDQRSGRNRVVCPMSYALYSQTQCVQIRWSGVRGFNNTNGICTSQLEYMLYNGGVTLMSNGFVGNLSVTLGRGVTVDSMPRPANMFQSRDIAIGATTFTVSQAGFFMPPNSTSFFALPVRCAGSCPCVGFTSTSFVFTQNIRISPPVPPSPPPPQSPPPPPVPAPLPPYPPGTFCNCPSPALGSTVCPTGNIRGVFTLFAYNPLVETSVFYSVCLPAPTYDEYGAEFVFSTCLAQRCLPSVFAGQRYRLLVNNVTGSLERMPEGLAAVQAVTFVASRPVATNVVIRPANRSLASIGPYVARVDNTNFTVPSGGISGMDITMVVDANNDENTVAIAIKSWATVDPAPSLPTTVPLIVPSTPVIAASFTLLRYVAGVSGLRSLLRQPTSLVSFNITGYSLMIAVAFSDYSILPDCTPASISQFTGNVSSLLGLNVSSSTCTFASAFNNRRALQQQQQPVDNACLANNPIFIEMVINTRGDPNVNQSAYQVALLQKYSTAKICITRVRVYTGVILNQISLGARRRLIAGVSPACQSAVSNLDVPLQQMARLTCYMTTAAEAGLVPPSPPPPLVDTMPPASAPPSDDGGSDFPIGAVVGGVVGGVLLLAVILALLILYRKKRAEQERAKPFSTLDESTLNVTPNALATIPSPTSAGASNGLDGTDEDERTTPNGTPVVTFTNSPSKTPIKRNPNGRSSQLRDAAGKDATAADQGPQCHASYVYEPPVHPLSSSPLIPAVATDIPAEHLDERGSGRASSGGAQGPPTPGARFPLEEPSAGDPLGGTDRTSAPVITSAATLAAAAPSGRELRRGPSHALRQSASGRLSGAGASLDLDAVGGAGAVVAAAPVTGTPMSGMESRRMFRQRSVSAAGNVALDSPGSAPPSEPKVWVGEGALQPTRATPGQPPLPPVVEAPSPITSPVKTPRPIDVSAYVDSTGGGSGHASPSSGAPRPSGGRLPPLAHQTAGLGAPVAGPSLRTVPDLVVDTDLQGSHERGQSIMSPEGSSGVLPTPTLPMPPSVAPGQS